MASKTNKKPVEKAAVVADNITEQPAVAESTGDRVTLAVHLPMSHIIDDLPDGSGGVKSLELPGLNAPGGILLGTGAAKAVTISRADWENILRLHGRERMYNSYNGNPPCVMEIKTLDALKGDEVQAMTHGLEPIKPEAAGVKEAKQGE